MLERVKTLTIAILFLSLVGLALLNWFYWSAMSFDTPFEGAGDLEHDAVMDVARPISGDYDRYRVSLGELLGTADSSKTIMRRVWDAAIADGGVYFEFLCPTPVWLMAEGLSFTAAVSDIFDDVTVYEMILNENGLFIFDGETYSHFSAPLPIDLPERLEHGDFNGTSGTPSPAIAAYPYVEMSSRFLEEPYFSELLESFGFSTNINSQYMQPDGDTVVVDDARTLHINPNGRVIYHDGTSYTDEGEFDERAAIRLCLGAIPRGPAFWGEGQLVFNSASWSEDEFSISLTYVLHGAVFLEWQTVFVVRNGILREAVMHLAPATVTDTVVKLMPRERAEVLLPKGGRIYVGYSLVEKGVWAPDWYGG